MEEKVHVVKNTTKIIPTIKGEVRLWKMTSKLTIEESTMEIESFKLYPNQKEESSVNDSLAQPTVDDTPDDSCFCTEFMKRNINFLICDQCRSDDLIQWKTKDQFIFEVFSNNVCTT